MEYIEGMPVQFTRQEIKASMPPTSASIDDGIDFWEGVIAAENDIRVKTEENEDEMD